MKVYRIPVSKFLGGVIALSALSGAAAGAAVWAIAGIADSNAAKEAYEKCRIKASVIKENVVGKCEHVCNALKAKRNACEMPCDENSQTEPVIDESVAECVIVKPEAEDPQTAEKPNVVPARSKRNSRHRQPVAPAPDEDDFV